MPLKSNLSRSNELIAAGKKKIKKRWGQKNLGRANDKFGMLTFVWEGWRWKSQKYIFFNLNCPFGVVVHTYRSPGLDIPGFEDAQCFLEIYKNNTV